MSASELLPGMGPAGIWGAETASIYSRLASRQAPGRWISAAISFPDASMFDIGVPAVGATTWLFDHGDTEVISTLLPLVERRHDLVGAAVLLSLAAWLAGG